MPSDTKPLSQQYNEAVEELKAQGISNANAIRQVADQFGKEANAIRGGIHQWKARHTDGTTPARAARARKTTEPTVDALLATARRSLEEALALVDREVEQAKAALDAAQAQYDQVAAGAKDKKADIQKKLKALG